MNRACSRFSSLLLAAATVAAAVGHGGCRRRPADRPSDASAATPSPVKIIYPAAPGSFVKVVAKAARSLVHIRTDLPVRDGPADWFPASRLPPTPGTEEWTARIQRALGSGFIVDRRGHIVTNAHIVGEKRKIWVRLADGTELRARVVGHDDRTDLAVLKVTPPANTDLNPARLGQSKSIKVGEWVIALGDPFGFGHRIDVGVVSALPLHNAPAGYHGYWGYIQTTASISAGNSGGPLINTVGEVIGLATMVKDEAGTSGVGFALPIDTVTRLLGTLKREGKIVRSWVGMYIDRVTTELAKKVNLKEPRGALITSVVRSGPADRAGLRTGDVVLSFGEHEIHESTQLPWLAAVAGVGRAVQVTVWRGGKRLTFSLRTAKMPE